MGSWSDRRARARCCLVVVSRPVGPVGQHEGQALLQFGKFKRGSNGDESVTWVEVVGGITNPVHGSCCDSH